MVWCGFSKFRNGWVRVGTTGRMIYLNEAAKMVRSDLYPLLPAPSTPHLKSPVSK